MGDALALQEMNLLVRLITNSLIGISASNGARSTSRGGWLGKHGLLSISHETMYKAYLGRQERRKLALEPSSKFAQNCDANSYGAYDSRGRIAEKGPISEHPQEVETQATRGY